MFFLSLQFCGLNPSHFSIRQVFYQQVPYKNPNRTFLLKDIFFIGPWYLLIHYSRLQQEAQITRHVLSPQWRPPDDLLVVSKYLSNSFIMDISFWDNDNQAIIHRAEWFMYKDLGWEIEFLIIYSDELWKKWEDDLYDWFSLGGEWLSEMNEEYWEDSQN